MPNAQYEKKFRITFADTNAEGNVSQFEYARYFGIVRELFAMDCIPNFVAEAGKRYLLKTQNASYEYLKDFCFADTMLIRLRVRDLTSAALTLEADFINMDTSELHARASQQIVYTDVKGIPRRIPAEYRVLLEAMLS